MFLLRWRPEIPNALLASDKLSLHPYHHKRICTVKSVLQNLPTVPSLTSQNPERANISQIEQENNPTDAQLETSPASNEFNPPLLLMINGLDIIFPLGAPYAGKGLLLRPTTMTITDQNNNPSSYLTYPVHYSNSEDPTFTNRKAMRRLNTAFWGFFL